MRLIKKEKIEEKWVKVYDKARTPYMRVLELMPEGARKARFKEFHSRLNPWLIKEKITYYTKSLLEALREAYEANKYFITSHIVYLTRFPE